jgi:hypothetical protein
MMNKREKLRIKCFGDLDDETLYGMTLNQMDEMYLAWLEAVVLELREENKQLRSQVSWKPSTVSPTTNGMYLCTDDFKDFEACKYKYKQWYYFDHQNAQWKKFVLCTPRYWVEIPKESEDEDGKERLND